MNIKTLKTFASSLKNARIIACLTFVFGVSFYSQAQESSFPSVQVVQGELISPDAAMVYYNGVDTSTAGLTVPIGEFDYHQHEDSRLKDIASSLGYDQAKWTTLSATQLVKAENDFVDAVYEYVHNGVEFTPMFGLHHGAMGAAIFGAGTSFDQAHLVVELMHVANISAQYRLGVFAPTATQFKEWFGTDVPMVACHLLADGGIPAEVNGASSCDGFTGYASDPNISVSMLHIWALITVDSTEYAFDPSVKKHKIYAGELNLASLAGITGSGAQAAVGGTVTGTTYAGFNPKTLGAYLNASSQTLLTELKKEENAGKSLNQALGGLELIVESGAPRHATLPGQASIKGTWSNIPVELTAAATLSVYPNSTNQSTITIPVQRIGADFVVFSPIDVSAGGLDTAGLNAYNKDALFELSILRPGSASHVIQANTGTNDNPSIGINNTPSGDNLLVITAPLRNVVNGGFGGVIDFNFPGASSGGNYLNHTKRSSLTTNIATVFIIRSGEIQRTNLFYERSIPQKTNLWNGTYIQNAPQVNACNQAEADYASAIADGFGYSAAYNQEYSAIYVPSDGSAEAACVGGFAACTPSGCTYPLAVMACSGITAAENASSHLSAATAAQQIANSASAQNELVVRTAVNNSCLVEVGQNRIKHVSTDKQIKLKASILDQWHVQSGMASNLNAQIGNGRSTAFSSIGFVSQTTRIKIDLTSDGGDIWIDVDSNLGYVPLSVSSAPRRVFAVSNAASLSAVEMLGLQAVTNSPRVDAAISKMDWYGWNAGYDPLTGVHAGPYGSGYQEGVSSPNGSPSVVQTLEDGFTVVKPARDDLGPVEDDLQLGPDTNSYYFPTLSNEQPYPNYVGRTGRDRTTTAYRYLDGNVAIAHTVGPNRKGGGSIELPEIDPAVKDADELAKQEYGKAFGDFSVDPKNGSFTFSLPADVSVGSGDDTLEFVRTYESVNAGNSPLGQGWSHNFDTKIIMTMDLKAAFEGPNLQSAIPAIVAAVATHKLADDALTSGNLWPALPQSLLIHAWMARNIFDGQVIITTGEGSETFFRVPGGGFTNVSNPLAQLTQSGNRDFYEAMRPYNDPIALDAAFGGAPGVFNADTPQNPLYLRRNWVSYEQFYDYSGIGFIYTSTNKTVSNFSRKPNSGLSNFVFSCQVFDRRLYVGGADTTKCGKGVGVWAADNMITATGREIQFIMNNVTLPTVTLGDFVAPALHEIKDVRYNRSIFFEYEVNPGAIRLELPNISDDGNPNALPLAPASYVSQGQGFRLKKVYAGTGTKLQEVVFNYDTNDNRTSPLLSSFMAANGVEHQYQYTPLSVGDLNVRDQKHYLTSFTPSSATVPLFALEYDEAARVTKITDGDGYTTQHGINGVRNRSVDGLGNETVSLYDPMGRLIEMIEPSYEGDAP